MSNRTRLAVFAGAATLLCSAALGPVFDGMSWLLPAAGAIAIVVGVGELSRRLGLPVALTPLVTAAAIACYVTAVFAAASAVAFVLPGPGAIAELRELVVAGMSDIRVQSPPVIPSSGLVLITVVGVAAVAMVVDLLAVTLRQAALAGLPLLALFAVPASVVTDGVGWLPFVLGGSGFLALLLADGRDRLARWGRPLGLGRVATSATPDVPEQAETSPLAAVGRRIGVAALGVAVVVPALVPGLHPGLFGSGGSGLPTSNGSDTVATYNPIARLQGYLLQRTPQELMRVTTSDPDPGYLRMVALDVFDGTTWSESPLSVTKESRISKGRLPAPDGLKDGVDSSEITSKIKVRDLDVHWLPVPYPATNVKVKGWNYDKATATIFSTRSSTRRLSYSVTSRKVAPRPAQLRQVPEPDPAQLGAFLQHPPLGERMEGLVLKITADAPDAYSKAVAIQSYFRSGFTYDVRARAGNGTSALENFIENKRGYCEQFAAAMAIFARQADIPARVAIGFTRGERQDDGSWKVTTADAHAWPELYFEGAGWLRFEPSPLGEGRAVDPGYTRPGATGELGGGTGEGNSGGQDDPSATGVLGKLNRQLEDDAVALPPPDAAVAASEPDGGPPAMPLLLGALVLLAAFPPVSRAVLRRHRWSVADTAAARAHAAWAELRDDAVDLGHPWTASDSPRSAGAGLIHRAGLGAAAADAVRLLVRAEERARYSLQPADGVELKAAVGTVRSELRSRASRGRRWQARLVPRSGLRVARSLGTALADLWDAADLAAARLRGRLLRRSAA